VTGTSARTYARRRIVALLGLIAVVGLVALTAGAIGDGTGRGHARAAHPAHGAATSRALSPTSRPHSAPAPSLAGIPVGRWTDMPTAPTSRGEVSAAPLGQMAYVVGGFDQSGRTTATVQRLDLRDGRWSTSVEMPEPLNHMSAVGYDGKLYVVGGYSQPSDTSAGAVRGFWRFDPATGRWSVMPDAPLARAAAGAAVLGHRLYVAGGRTDTLTTISTLAIFDFDTGKWSLGPPLQHPREHVAAVAADGAVWVLGGRALGQGNFTYVERYRPGASEWQQMPTMPIARSGFQAVAVRGKVVVVGGEGPAGTIGEVDRLDPSTGRWSRLPDLPTPRHGLGLVAEGPLVFAIDGGPHPGLTTSSVVQRLRVP
jgi:Galactose oxidase, central domain/Kelch motif